MAAVEVRIDWQAYGISHRNRLYYPKFNFWRDILPGGLSMTLPDSDGDWVSEDFPAGELVAPWREGNLHTVRRSALKLHRRHGPPVELHAGRHYPRYIAAGLPDIFEGNVKPLRVSAIEEDRVTVDLNHALAKLPMTVSARIVRRIGTTGEHGGRCNDPLLDLLNVGAGLEQLHPDNGFDLDSAPFARLDDRADDLFYSKPRFVQHLDSTSLGHVTDIYARHLEDGMQVLDLMSSWVSHLPEDRDLQVTGIGMNAEELAKNDRLNERIVHDLNTAAPLPCPDAHFDAAVSTASIEYLTDPVRVIREVGRVLRPGAPFVTTFSDRSFPTKAITVWNTLHPQERVALVLECFLRAGNFTDLAAECISGYPRPGDDKYAGELASSDPVFAVSGRRTSG